MAASKKRRQAADAGDNASSGSENEGSDAEEVSEEEVMVDFEARVPDDGDFHGIKALLQQLFPKAHINVSELADLLIEQNYITSVLKQCAAADMDVDSSDDDETMDSEDVVFGVLSVINLMQKKDKDFNKELRTHLLDKCQKACIPEKFSQFEKMLGNDSNPIGLILSERFINIPARISLPLYNSLNDDLKTAIRKNKPFNFTNYMIISKIVDNDEGSDIDYMNAEEEFINEDAELVFDYSVSAERDSGLSGTWDEDDAEGHSKRRVMIFPATKWENFLSKLRNEFAAT